jgi:hypothetical protein
LVEARAELRRRELLLARDRANLQQALHEASHSLATSYRNLAQFYEEYKAFKDTRDAAQINLDAQTARWPELTIYLNVLQANAAWGEAVNSEAQALLQYNTELANLQQQMGTILESHGIQFTEESFRSLGPIGRLGHCRDYPLDRRPCPNVDRYPPGDEPAENAFDLKDLKLPKPESRRRSRTRPTPGGTDVPESRSVRPGDLRDLFAPGNALESLPRPADDD